VIRKPNSVPASAPRFRAALRRDDDHSSSPAIAGGIKRPTRKHRTGRPKGLAAHASLFGLAPCGVLPATRVATSAVRSYRTFSPLPLDSPLRGSLGEGSRFRSRACRERAPKGRVERLYVFCATFLQVTLTGRYPAHCPAEFGLSSRLRALRATRAGKPRQPYVAPMDLSAGAVRRTRRRTIIWITAAAMSTSLKCWCSIADC
jgi:hypothetical protein